MFRWFEEWVNPFEPYDENREVPRKIGRFFLEMLWPVRWAILIALLLSAIEAFAEILMFQYVQRLVDLLTESKPDTLWAEHGGELLFMALVVLLFKPVVEFIGSMVQSLSYLTPVGAMVRWRTHRQVLRQSVGYFQNDFAGRIAQKIIQTGPAVADTVYTALDALWYAAIYCVGAIILLSGFDWRLVVVFLVWFAAYLGLAWYIVPRSGKAAMAMSEARSALTGRIVDSYTNIQTVKLFAHSDREDEYARESIRETWVTFRKQMRIFVQMDIGLLAINTALIGAISGTGIWLWSIGELGVGAIAAATALVMRMTSLTHWIMWSLMQLFANLGVAMEGHETISKPIEIKDAPNAKPLAVSQGALKFTGIRYMYGRDIGGIDRVDLSIAPGERIGLIGRSGAGKSTLVNLLLRFYDLEQGRVEIDDVNIAEVTQESLRSQISVVTQDTALLHRSVRDNILYGRPDAGEDALIEAARRARAEEFIADLEDPEGRKGYDAHVGERGVKLSGGQRQRIAIARAILKDAPILVLDEATSALDSEVEAEIQNELLALMQGKTVIAIAHRLSTIAHLDRIIVLDKGQIVEEGTHSVLIDKNGLYAGFWKRQSGGFLNLQEG